MSRFFILTNLLLVVVSLLGCSKSVPPTGPQFRAATPALADFSDHDFDDKRYLVGMVEVEGEDIWFGLVKGATLPGTASFQISQLDNRFLAQHKKIPTELLQKTLLTTLAQSLNIENGADGSTALRLEAMVVEADPGSRIARYLIGIMGAGKASAEVVLEVFEPGQAQPSLRLYGKGARGMGGFGGDSAELLQLVVQELTQKLANHLRSQLTP